MSAQDRLVLRVEFSSGRPRDVLECGHTPPTEFDESDRMIYQSKRRCADCEKNIEQAATLEV